MKASDIPSSKTVQAHILANKIKHGWNTTDTNFEMLLAYHEMAELTTALLKDDHANIAEELADITIYLLGIAEMTDVDLAQAVHKKVAINDHRVYDEHGHKHLE